MDVALHWWLANWANEVKRSKVNTKVRTKSKIWSTRKVAIITMYCDLRRTDSIAFPT